MITCLKAEKQATQYFFQYTLDDSKVLADGTPDPAYIRQYSFSPTPPNGVTEDAYQELMKQELLLYTQSESEKITPPIAVDPTPLTGF